jgi:hypothetical protein
MFKKWLFTVAQQCVSPWSVFRATIHCLLSPPGSVSLSNVTDMSMSKNVHTTLHTIVLHLSSVRASQGGTVGIHRVGVGKLNGLGFGVLAETLGTTVENGNGLRMGKQLFGTLVHNGSFEKDIQIRLVLIFNGGIVRRVKFRGEATEMDQGLERFRNALVEDLAFLQVGPDKGNHSSQGHLLGRASRDSRSTALALSRRVWHVNGLGIASTTVGGKLAHGHVLERVRIFSFHGDPDFDNLVLELVVSVLSSWNGTIRGDATVDGMKCLEPGVALLVGRIGRVRSLGAFEGVQDTLKELNEHDKKRWK